MAQKLKTLFALAEDLDLILSTHTAVHNLPERWFTIPSSKGSDILLTPRAPGMHEVHINTFLKNILNK